MKTILVLVKTPINDFKIALRSIFTQGTIGINSLLSFTSLSMRFSSSAVLIMVLARMVDVSILGEILYATVFANIVVTMASYGFENLIIRDISQERYSIHGITINLLVAKLILSTALVLAVMLFTNLVRMPLKHSGDLWFYFGAALINSFINALIALRKGQNDFVTGMYISLFGSGFLFVGTLVAILYWDATTLLVGQVRLFTQLVAFVIAVAIFLKKTHEETQSTRWQGAKLATVWTLFVVGFPFGLQAVLGTAYFRLDVIVLGALKTSTEVGFYQAPMQLISALMLLPIAVIQAYYPRLSKAFSEAGSEGLLLMRQMMGVLVVLGFCFMALFSLGAPFIITILYGAKMEPSIQVMQILSALFLVRSISGGLGISLMAMGMEKATAWAGLVALIGSLGLNFLLIPGWGFIATTWVNLLINFCVLCIYFLGWRKGWKTFCSRSTAYVD